MKSIPISEIILARNVSDLIILKETGIVTGGSPASAYPAHIMLPSKEDHPKRHQEITAEIPAKYRASLAKGQPLQV